MDDAPLMNALEIIGEHAKDGAALRVDFFRRNAAAVDELSRAMALCMARGGKILLCGNGGSAADAQHLAAEFINRFQLDRPSLPAVALTTDTSALTAIGNDFGFDQVFSKQVQGLGQPGDMLLGISTSGNSPNVIKALETAREKSVTTAGLSGAGGGDMLRLCDHLLIVDDPRTPLIQEVHIAVGHLLCRLVDYYLFENVLELQPLLEQHE